MAVQSATESSVLARSALRLSQEGFTPDRVRGLILAGVHACCESPAQRRISGPLAEILGRPLIVHTLEWLRSAGIGGATICANSDTAAVRHLLRDGRAGGICLDYYEDMMPRGPAGCVRDASTRHDCHALVVVEGTILPQVNLRHLLEFHTRTEASLTIVSCSTAPSTQAGHPDLRPVGIYVFSPRAVKCIPEVGYIDIKEVLIPRLHQASECVAVYVTEAGEMPRLLSSSSYLSLSDWAVQEAVAADMPQEGYVRCGSALVHESAGIGDSVQFVGPVWVGAGCRIENGSIIIGPSGVGARSIVRRQAVVNRSTLWGACRVDPKAVVDRCVLLDEAVVAAGATVRDALIVPGGRWRDKQTDPLLADFADEPCLWAHGPRVTAHPPLPRQPDQGCWTGGPYPAPPASFAKLRKVTV